jgi:hypothetical protein
MELFISGLDNNVSERDLRDFFDDQNVQIGKLKLIKKDDKSPISFVDILNRSDFDQMVNLRNPSIQGRKIRL